MEPNPAKDLARKARRLRIVRKSFCTLCGYGAWPVLRRVRRTLVEQAGRTLLEEHHVVGRAHDASLLVTLCANCHTEVTEALRVGGVSMRPAPPGSVRVAVCLVGLAVFMDRLATSLRAWAAELEDCR